MPNHTAAVQDYLKTMQLLEWDRGAPVATQELAERLGVSPASATNMLKRLASLGLLDHEPYRGATLTPAGRKVALEVIRHHRLLETYLAEALGVPWDRVHDEAEVLEHVLSEDLEDRIAALLGEPEADPHGHPIPSKDGRLPRLSARRLWDLAEGEVVSVQRVSDHEAAALRFLASAGIKPGAMVAIVGRGPLAGPLFVRVEDVPDEVHALSKDLAEAVWVA
ncbi:MAG TPA: metal-dependent transcriptional regulator [Actinomycetota bacterium]|nr:metal-dependent transcriptional regulator [Actinomycetota bacterium]